MQWGNQCGYGKIRGVRHYKPMPKEEALASMRQELANKLEQYPEDHWVIKMQKDAIARMEAK